MKTFHMIQRDGGGVCPNFYLQIDAESRDIAAAQFRLASEQQGLIMDSNISEGQAPSHYGPHEHQVNDVHYLFPLSPDQFMEAKRHFATFSDEELPF